MRGHQLRRLATVASTALLSVMLLGTGSATATTPTWSMTVVPLPSTVQSAKDAGYLVTISNDGTSNISSLFLGSSLSSSPTYVGTPSQGTCTVAGVKLSCSFGAVPAQAGAASKVHVIVAYKTSTTGNTDCDGSAGAQFSFNFQASTGGDTSGNPGADKKGNSHGDSLTSLACTNLSTSADFGGGFSSSLADAADASISRTNLQSTAVTPPQTGIVVTVEDNLADGTFDCSAEPSCANRFGEWSRLDIDNGHNFGHDTTPKAFRVTLVLAGSSVPAGATVNTINLIHVLDDGTAYPISQRCTPTTGTPTNAECITVTKSGNNFQIVAWLFQNGGIRGTF